MNRFRRTLIVATLLLLGGCAPAPARTGVPVGVPAPAPAGSAPASAAPGGAFNETDVMFLQMMVTSHGQGLALVRLAPERAEREELKILAAAIDVTQEAEQRTMRDWLRGWGRSTSADPDANAHAEHGGLPVLGPAQLSALSRSSGTKFETDFLNLLIGHQHNAVELARMETTSGVHPEVRELARRIDLSRTAQIDQMLKMLRKAG
ncbi:DUF305 domain-containing protein [Plantactinospora sp. KLBMP9567]|uniref:DUF305 domain-containing protein n=1 Tax=Plantactinospora sp. KLBMP9567 TaxID=3085900 RepID=UPI002981120C|nr:DUF305 domain-containing protein [Plantactinospora sp. KLBMP9567]MDW5324685.1 DUF305 domain-containing protein [Plantactinospora sp. KLBMP9567]